MNKNEAPKRVTLESHIDGSVDLTDIQAMLAAKISGIRLKLSEKFHVTLGHLGVPDELFMQVKAINPKLTRELFDTRFQQLLSEVETSLPNDISVKSGDITKLKMGAIVLKLDKAPFAKANAAIYSRTLHFLSTLGIPDPAEFAADNPNLMYMSPDKFIPHVTLGKVDPNCAVPADALTGYRNAVNVNASKSYIANNNKKPFNK